ncbi:MAG: protein kinase domain-containing protein [Chloroflexota bacterium]
MPLLTYMNAMQRLSERYSLGRPIGSGGMATVYLAHDLTLDRDVAIKVLPPQRSADPAFVERFKREARAAGGLNHPNVVSIYDQGETPAASFGAGVDGNAYYIVMEYAPGGNLAEAVARRGALPEAEALGIGVQIAAALDAAHSRGIIHRDVKPQNVLLTADGRVKVADFGIARAVDTGALTRTSEVLGSAQYLSPEQAQGKLVDARSDVYSLGVVLYELLTGRPPFAADTPLAVVLHHLNDAPAPLRGRNSAVSPQAEAIVLKALAKDPDRRYPTAAAMRLALEDLRRSDSVATHVTRTTPAIGGAVAARPRLPATRPVPAPRLAHPQRQAGATYGGRLRRRRRSGAWFVAPALLLLFLAGVGVFAARQVGGATTATAGPRIASPSPSAVLSPTPLPLVAVPPPATSSPQPTATPLPHPTAVATVAAPPTATAATVPTPIVAASPAPPVAVSPPPIVRPTAVPTVQQQPPATAVAAILVTSSAAGSVPASADPAQTVIEFYTLVGGHQFDRAAQLWSAALQANFPPSANINGRFANVQEMTVRRAVVTAQTTQTATVAVDVVELDSGTPGSRREYVGAWQLVRGADGWLLNQPSLQTV